MTAENGTLIYNVILSNIRSVTRCLWIIASSWSSPRSGGSSISSRRSWTWWWTIIVSVGRGCSGPCSRRRRTTAVCSGRRLLLRRPAATPCRPSTPQPRRLDCRVSPFQTGTSRSPRSRRGTRASAATTPGTPGRRSTTGARPSGTCCSAAAGSPSPQEPVLRRSTTAVSRRRRPERSRRCRCRASARTARRRRPGPTARRRRQRRDSPPLPTPTARPRPTTDTTPGRRSTDQQRSCRATSRRLHRPAAVHSRPPGSDHPPSASASTRADLSTTS